MPPMRVLRNPAGKPIAISVRQPWAWLIVNGLKDLENRTWETRVRGRVLLHAGKGMTLMELHEAILFVGTFDRALARRMIAMPAHEWVRGAVIGSVEITGCVSASSSPWFVGPFGFTLARPLPIEPVKCRGMLGFFGVDELALQAA